MNGLMAKVGRVAMGLSQGELAQRAGVSLPTLARFESGHDVLLATYLKIFQALDRCEFIETKDGFELIYKK
jgi:predicted transcriptional regulator